MNSYPIRLLIGMMSPRYLLIDSEIWSDAAIIVLPDKGMFMKDAEDQWKMILQEEHLSLLDSRNELWIVEPDEGSYILPTGPLTVNHVFKDAEPVSISGVGMFGIELEFTASSKDTYAVIAERVSAMDAGSF